MTNRIGYQFGSEMKPISINAEIHKVFKVYCATKKISMKERCEWLILNDIQEDADDNSSRQSGKV